MWISNSEGENHFEHYLSLLIKGLNNEEKEKMFFEATGGKSVKNSQDNPTTVKEFKVKMNSSPFTVQDKMMIAKEFMLNSKIIDIEDSFALHAQKSIRTPYMPVNVKMQNLLNDILEKGKVLNGERQAIMRRYGGYADKIHEEDWQRINDAIITNKQPDKDKDFYAHTFIKLKHPFINRHGEEVVSVQIKRIGFDENKEIKKHVGSGYVPYHFSATPQGGIIIREKERPSPEGAMLWINAAREMVNTHLLHHNEMFNYDAHTKTPLGVGLFPNAPLFNDEPLGFVLLGVTELGLQRADNKDSDISKVRNIPKTTGRILRIMLGEGFIHNFLDSNNLSIDFDSEISSLPIVHDLDNMQNIEIDSLTKEQLLAFVIGEFYVHGAVFYGNNASLDLFLEGYFRTKDARSVLENFHDSDSLLYELHRLIANIYDNYSPEEIEGLHESFESFPAISFFREYINQIKYWNSSESENATKKSTLLKSGSSAITPGGISLNPNQFEIESRGNDLELKLPQDLNNVDFDNIEGFIPVIINIVPHSSINSFLGLNDLPKEKRLSRR